MRAFLVGCLVGAALWWGVGMLTAPSPDEVKPLERSEQAAAVRAERLRDTLERQLPGAVRWRERWDTLVRVDSIPLTDTVYVREMILTADSAIRSCHNVLQTCAALVQAEKERADKAHALAKLWERAARGPFLQKSAEVFLEDGRLMGAAELEAGRGRVSAVARVEVDTLTRLSWGVRVKF